MSLMAWTRAAWTSRQARWIGLSRKIARPVISKVQKGGPDHFTSDCPMAAEQIVQDLDEHDPNNPMSLLRKAYGI